MAMPETARRPALSKFLDKWLYAMTGAYVLLMLLSLRYRFLDPFIATTWHGKIGLDFFAVPRGFINLLHGKSIYDTWAFAWGPYASWYPYHPAAAVLAGSWLSLFSPWAAYGVFVAVSLAILIYCARLAGRGLEDSLSRKALYFLFLCSPCAYLMLWNGQLHVLTVLSVSLIAAELFDAAKNPGVAGLRVRLLAGVLCSLLSRPLILPALPLLFAVKKFRATMLWSLGIYAVVSLLFLAVPALNPAGAGFDALVDAVVHPGHIFQRALDGNIIRLTYKTAFLHDNAIHWLNMRNLSAVVRADVFEFMSPSSFFADICGGVNPVLFKLPLLLLGVFSLGLFFIKDQFARNRAAVYVFAFSVLAFYMAYDSVYEYHFTTLLAVAAFLFAAYQRGAQGFRNGTVRVICAACALFYVPTSYYWVRNPDFGYHGARTAAWPLKSILTVLDAQPYAWALWMIRLLRVVPVLALFAAMSYIIIVELRKGISDGREN
ncbi:MAG: hypothetical protein PHP45_02670 [Elusimicrobiales bacterium]|nr:hypothetical protein [Elusimicrobiales bacterium]